MPRWLEETDQFSEGITPPSSEQTVNFMDKLARE
jgi:hypothetical protein